MATERLALLVEAKTDGAARSLKQLNGTVQQSGKAADQAEKKLRGLSTEMRIGVGIAAGVAAVKLAQLGGDALRAASDLEQAAGGTKAVFGDAGNAIDDFAKRSANAVGLSEAAFREATTLLGGQLKRMTGDVDLASDASIKLVEVGADLAATYGGTTKEAVDAFAAALRGEADPAERFNLNLKISEVNAKAVALGLAKSTGEVDEAAKAQALLALVTEQSADAQGQFAREGDTAAVASQKASAAWENAKASLGQALLPALATGAKAAEAFSTAMAKLPPGTQLAVTGIAAVGAAALIAGPKVLALRRELELMGITARGAAASMGAWGIALAAGGFVVAEFQQQLAESEGGVKGYLGAITDAASILTNPFAAASDKAREKAEQLSEAQIQQKATNEAAVGSWKAHQAAVDADTTSIEGATTALQQYADEQRKAIDPVFALTDAVEGVDEAQRAFTEAMKEHGEGSQEVETASYNVAKAVSALEQAALNGDLSFEDFSGKLRNWVKMGLVTEAQAEEIAEGVAHARGEAESFNKTYRPRIELKAFGLLSTLEKVNSLQAQLDRLSGRHVAFSVDGITRGTGLSARQHGGPVSRDRPYLVGEDGAEILYKGRVYPSGQVPPALTATGHGGTMVIQHFHFPHYVGTRQELVSAVRDAVTAKGGNVQTILGR